MLSVRMHRVSMESSIGDLSMNHHFMGFNTTYTLKIVSKQNSACNSFDFAQNNNQFLTSEPWKSYSSFLELRRTTGPAFCCCGWVFWTSSDVAGLRGRRVFRASMIVHRWIRSHGSQMTLQLHYDNFSDCRLRILNVRLPTISKFCVKLLKYKYELQLAFLT